jgi:hypothetical protein
MDKPESFEVQEYNKFEDPYEKYKVLRQIVEDRKFHSPSAPTEAFRVDFVGDTMKVFYTTYEMFLPTRIKEVEKHVDDALSEIVKFLKKEYKSRTKQKLSITENKELRDYTVQKVSLNERYYYTAWRCFEMK